MKRKFTHEEIVVTTALVICSSSFFYFFSVFMYNIIVTGVNLSI